MQKYKSKINKKIGKFVLVLHNIRSRFNVGAIFRTADAAGINKIYLCGITPAPPHPKINKVALGAEKFIPYEKHWQTGRLIKKLKKEGHQILALEQSKKSAPYFKLKPNSKAALILGNEIKGLPPKILRQADKILEIPMRGKKESLNVAVACGIVCFEIAKYF
ncbi:MAG: RNA methyltransferase [Patescibacteria group bacterium]